MNRTVAVIAGAILGAGVGVGAHALFAFLGGREGPFEALFPFTSSSVAFALLGSVLGIGLAGALARVAGIEHVVRTILALVTGALAGLAMYAVGYVIANYIAEPIGTAYLFYLLEALYSSTYVEVFCVGLGAAIGLIVVKSDWRFFGILAYVSLASVVVGYLSYAVFVSIPLAGPEGRTLSLTLLTAESASLLLVVVYAFYSLDVSMRRRWRRLPRSVPFSRYFVPKVAFHVTVFNEPADMVIDTLEALERVDYPADRRVVMVLDDSTEEATAREVRAWCASRGHAYLHRKDRAGYKAGALNGALRVTPPDVDLISVIDADFQVEPEYLRETVGYFVNPNLGFLQTPQDYRNREQSFLTRQYYLADAYFYRAVLPSRNEENTIIFCGTMGLIRRSALVEVGGWAEDCVTEDSELSVRVLERGYDSLYVNKTYGRGLIPPLFEAYKKQLYRWSFGGIQILRRHFARFVFGRMSLRQKMDFVVGSLHWFDGVFVVAIAAILGYLALGDLLGRPVVTFHQREILLIGLVPFFLLLDGITRLHLAMRRSMSISLGETIRVLGIWFAIKFNNMFASLKSFAGVSIPFVRTPKAPARRIGRWEAWGRAIRLNRFESLVGLLLLGLAFAELAVAASLYARIGFFYASRAMLVAWLLYYALVFLAAPIYAYRAYVTFVPDHELAPARTGGSTVSKPTPRRS